MPWPTLRFDCRPPLWLDPAPMPNSSGTWKTGERALQPGRYECLNCRQVGAATEITVASGAIFPYCTVCNLKDNTYRVLPARK